MPGSCHLDRASNVEIGVECQIFVIVIFFNCGRVLQFRAHSRHYKGALTQKWSFLVICTTFRSDFHVGWKNQNNHSTLNSSFDALSKWHEPNNSYSISSFQYRLCITSIWCQQIFKNISRPFKGGVFQKILRFSWDPQTLVQNHCLETLNFEYYQHLSTK